MASGGSALSYAALQDAVRHQAANKDSNETPAQPPEVQEAEESPVEEEEERHEHTPPRPMRGLTSAVLNGCVGDFYRVINGLTNTLTDMELTLPQIVVIGEEGSGKSSVLESLAMLPLFPREPDLCTRLPILLKLRRVLNGIVGDPELMPHCRGNSHPDEQQFKMRLMYSDSREPIESERDFTRQEAASLMKKWMEQIVQEEHDDNKLKGVVDHVLEIEIRSPNVPNLTFVDLPGIVAGKLIDEPDDMMQRTRALVEKYLQMPDTLVLAVVPAFERVRNSQAFQLVQQYKLMDKTIGVLTMVDRALDDTNPEGPLAAVMNRLDGTSRDIVYLKEGYVAVRNRDTRQVPEVDLDEFKDEEDAWLKENLPGYMDRRLASSTVLVKKLEHMLVDHVIKSWVPQALARIKNEREKTDKELAKLGPDPQDIVNNFLHVSPSVARKRMLQLIKPVVPELMSCVDEAMLQFAALVHADFLVSREEHELILTPFYAKKKQSPFEPRSGSLVAASMVMLGSYSAYIAGHLARILKNVVLHIVRLVQKATKSKQNGEKSQRLDRFDNLHYFFAGVLWERLNELLIDEDGLLERLEKSFLEFDPENSSNIQLPTYTGKISLKEADELKNLANDLELYLDLKGFHSTSLDEVYIPTETSTKAPLTRDMSRLIISAQVPKLGKSCARGFGEMPGQGVLNIRSTFTPNGFTEAKQTSEEFHEVGEFELRLFFALTSHVIAPLLQSICDVNDLTRKMQEYVSSFPKIRACKTHIFHEKAADTRMKLVKMVKRLDVAAARLELP